MAMKAFVGIFHKTECYFSNIINTNQWEQIINNDTVLIPVMNKSNITKYNYLNLYMLDIKQMYQYIQNTTSYLVTLLTNSNVKILISMTRRDSYE